jgi:hypothetical protein
MRATRHELGAGVAKAGESNGRGAIASPRTARTTHSIRNEGAARSAKTRTALYRFRHKLTSDYSSRSSAKRLRRSRASYIFNPR